MAYRERYRFNFDSRSGLNCHISILQDGYTGTATVRPMGAGPVLRMDNGGAVRGTSLELTAECQVDREFTALYTSSAREFKVQLYVGSAVIWSGFVSPELYSEPDIAPPYDVKITATDGLGELKLSPFEAQGKCSILDLLSYLLSFTGIDRDIMAVSSLAAGDGAAEDMFSTVEVNLDHMAGESCYDVLSALMITLNAVITLNGEKWAIVRETDVVETSGTVAAFDASDGTSGTIPVRRFGSMTSYAWWPVGQLSTDTVPAKRTQTVAAPNTYKESALENSDMTSDSGWTKTGDASYSTQESAYLIPTGGAISQAVDFEAEVGYRLILKVRARNVGETSAEKQSLTVMVKATGRSYVSGTTFYLSNQDRSGVGAYGWSTDSSKRVVLELQSPQTSDTEADATDFEIPVPMYRNGSRDYFYASAVEVAIENAGTHFDQYVYECYLTVETKTTGWQDIIKIDNDARGDGSDVEILFPRITGSTVQGAAAFQYGVPQVDDETVLEWSTSAFSEMDFLSIISRDLAVGIALPRVRKTGTLNVPVTQPGLPLFFKDSDGVYLPETLSWDIFNDELDVTLLSVPDAVISVESEVVKVLPAGYSSGQGSRGSSGGGGVSEYGSLTGLPQINGITLRGNKTAQELRLVGTDMFELDTTSVPGKVLIRAKYDGLYSDGDIVAGGVGSGGGGGGSTVSWNQVVTTGTKIATITIDGEETDVYAPTGGGSSTLEGLTDTEIANKTNYDTLFYNNGKWRNIPFSQLANLTGLVKENGDARITGSWHFAPNNALEFTDTVGVTQIFGRTTGTTHDLYVFASNSIRLNADHVYVNDVEITGGGGGSTVSWGAESAGGVPLTVNNTTKTLALKSALSSYLPLDGSADMTGSIIPNSTSVNLGSSAKPWGEIHANKWYPKASDTTHYIEYTTNGFLVHGNLIATGDIVAGEA